MLGALIAPAPFATLAAQETHLVTVVGLGGGPEYDARFFGWGERITVAARERFGLPESSTHLLVPDAELPAPATATSRRDGVEATLAAIATDAPADAEVLVVLLGHGTFRNDEARFNLPGPDLTAREWSLLLDALAPRRVAIVNAASASGPFVQALAASNRTVITATKTGRQRNETVFGGYFADAFAGDAADLDKDGAMSLLEAFAWTTAEVARHYDEQGLLQTENAVLDDDGDGVGSETPSADEPDGAGSSTFVFVPAAALELPEAAAADSVLARLLREQAELETRIARLRARRGEMDPEAYEAELEELLVELALKNREVEGRRGGGGGGR